MNYIKIKVSIKAPRKKLKRKARERKKLIALQNIHQRTQIQNISRPP